MSRSAPVVSTEELRPVLQEILLLDPLEVGIHTVLLGNLPDCLLLKGVMFIYKSVMSKLPEYQTGGQ